MFVRKEEGFYCGFYCKLYRLFKGMIILLEKLIYIVVDSE